MLEEQFMIVNDVHHVIKKLTEDDNNIQGYQMYSFKVNKELIWSFLQLFGQKRGNTKESD